MNYTEINVVTGAFGYTGKYIARRLLASGKLVKTLTGHPGSDNPFGHQVQALPFNFDRPDELVQSLQGATTLYNTYWIRFSRGEITFDRAVENTRTLVRAAVEAGVRRLVHVSISNPSEDSPLPYFRGKALVERAIRESELSYAIIRPTIIFGVEDILLNNIAWLLRRFPLFTVAGDGEYRVQPVYVEDVAQLAVYAGQQDDNIVVDAVGPETYTFNEVVRLIRDILGGRARIVNVPPRVALFLSRMVGYLVGDVALTRNELEGLMANHLVSGSPPLSRTSLKEWLAENRHSIGTQYSSELRRHYR